MNHNPVLSVRSYRRGLTTALALIALAVPAACLQAAEPPEPGVDTVTEVENVARQAERAPQATEPLPPAKVVEGGQAADERVDSRPAAKTQAQHDNARISPTQLGMNFQGEQGESALQLKSVSPQSAASKVGLRSGDQIISVGGRQVSSADEIAPALVHAMNAASRDEHLEVPMIVRRDGQQHTLLWTNSALALAGYGPLLTEYGFYVPPQYVTGYRGNVDTPTVPANPNSGYLGVELNPRYPQVAIVARVMPGTAAADAGLREGDRIWGVNDRRVESMNDFILLVGQVAPGEELELHFDRAHSVRVTLGQRGQTTNAAAPSDPVTQPNEN